MEPAPTSDLSVALGTYLDAVDAAAPGLVEGLYVVGSAALGDWIPGHSDIDIVAVTAEPATDDDFRALIAAHADLSARQPLPHVDGVYVAWGDLGIEPATGLHRPWVLEGMPRHDGECFEVNPVTWYTLARHALVVRGPSPDTLAISVDMEARIRFVVDTLAGYWRTVATDIDAMLAGDPSAEWDATSFEWCALGALRLHHTAFIGEVISKSAAARYGLEVLPAEFHDVLHSALRVRTEGDRSTAIGATAMAVVARLVDAVVDEVLAAAG